ncbi:hypothetical protein J7M23_07385, partial [Candidatus Sumerlaeota bacterium]|nr:hypothetical protein [Candidatus Sumerlaeota bacterium]
MSSCNFKYLIVVCLAFACVPVIACANIPLPMVLGFFIPLWLSLLSFGLLFLAVVFVESLIVRVMTRLPLWKALKAVFVVNLVSTIVGGGITLAYIYP